tara:strand:+ start:3742 stop:4215 length:474 start_codon:yes stop_codon:yes gene_type:complete
MCVKDLYAYIRAFGTLNVYKQIVPTKPYIKKAKLITIAKKVKRPKNNIYKTFNNPLFNSKTPNKKLKTPNKKQETLNKQNNSNEYKAFMNDLITAVLNKQINMNEVGEIRAELRTQANKARFNQALNQVFTKNGSPSQSTRRSQRSKKSTRRNDFVY